MLSSIWTSHVRVPASGSHNYLQARRGMKGSWNGGCCSWLSKEISSRSGVLSPWIGTRNWVARMFQRVAWQLLQLRSHGAGWARPLLQALQLRGPSTTQVWTSHHDDESPGRPNLSEWHCHPVSQGTASLTPAWSSQGGSYLLGHNKS